MTRHDFFPGGRRAPRMYQDMLAHYGQNRLGENLFRVIWLPSRCFIAGGYWEREGTVGYRRIPKYGNEGKWAMEKWCPPSIYGSPRLWDMQTRSIEGLYQVGPFPAHGEYECTAVFSTGRGIEGYVPLEMGMVDLQARLVWMGRTRTQWDIRNGILEEVRAKDKANDEAFDILWEQTRLTRKGMTFGRGGKYSPEAEVSAMKDRILRRKDLWVREEDFSGGFGQQDEQNFDKG